MNELWSRKIIHIDMDAFFAAVEQLDHPEYRGKPVVVGGDPFGRGVVSTASYEARPYGIHSAMPAAHARRLCPHAIFLRPRFQRYREISDIVMSILRQHTDLIEAVSLDEAYLDITQSKVGILDPVIVATMLKQSIFTVTRLTASAGVAPNLFLAKIASDFNKPDGLTVICPNEVQEFLKDLPVRKIPGVGPVTEKELHKSNLKTCDDLKRAGELFLCERFGKLGSMLYRRALGIDHCLVEPATEAKQTSTEETFLQDTRDISWLESRLEEYAQEIYYGLKKRGRTGRTIVLKIKYFDFEVITRSRTINHTPSDWHEIYEIARHLLKTKTLAGQKPIRLLGLGFSGLRDLEVETLLQGDLFQLGY